MGDAYEKVFLHAMDLVDEVARDGGARALRGALAVLLCSACRTRPRLPGDTGDTGDI